MGTTGSYHSPDSGGIETAASQACTRSGTFALLLAVVLFLLSAYWLQEKKSLAAGQYSAYRYNLVIHLDALDADPFWQGYAQVNPGAEDLPISALFHATGTVTIESRETGGGGAALIPAVPSPVRKGDGQGKEHLAPARPTGLTATTSFAMEAREMGDIRKDIELLNDSKLLTRARQNSNFFEFSIVRWVSKLSTTMYANNARGICLASVIALPAKSTPAHYTPQFDQKAMVDCLTLRNVRDLARFEFPTIANPDSMMRHVAQDVDVSPGSFPKDPYMATIVAQGLLFLVLTYFAAFVREVASVETFPLRGTLFGVFSKSSWMTFVFFLALWVPFAACCTVLVASANVTLSIGLIPVALVTLFVQRTLERTTFFGSFRPLTFLVERFKFVRRGRKPEEPPSVQNPPA